MSVALPWELSGLALSAILQDAPPRIGEGYDLSKAPWMIKDFDLSQILSPRQFISVARLGRAAEANGTEEYLGIGDPSLGLEGVSKLADARRRGRVKGPETSLSFAPLPETADEIRAASKLFKKSKVLLHDQATEENFLKLSLGDFAVLHFATHGLAQEDTPGWSNGALVLTPGDPEDPYDDGFLTTDDIAKLTLRSRLVILSACNTTRTNPILAAQKVMDLQAAFIVAGAPALIGSLWELNSQTAEQIVTRFLAEWRNRPAGSATSALGKAVRAHLADAPELEQHPAYWAALNLVGDGSISGAVSQNTPAAQSGISSFETLSGFGSGGEIIDVDVLGNDLLMAIMGEWDGHRMNGIVSRRAKDGTERWRIDSRHIGIGRLTTSDNISYVAGYTLGGSIPVLRRFDGDGAVIWRRDYHEYSGYAFEDVLAVDKRLFVIYVQTLPELSPASSDGRICLWNNAARQRRVRIAMMLSSNGDSQLIRL